jgi:hypothetical protein
MAIVRVATRNAKKMKANHAEVGICNRAAGFLTSCKQTLTKNPMTTN